MDRTRAFDDQHSKAVRVGGAVALELLLPVCGRDDEVVGFYLAACPQPWRDVATLILATGMRPGEAFPLRWENVGLTGDSPALRISEGKSKAARRSIPLMPVAARVLRIRHVEQEQPTEGWVFPTGSESGHLEQGTAKRQHARALANSTVSPFEPYCLRHTALTNLAALGVDTYTIAKIAGHSSITITQRYCHPQKDAIEQAFAQFAKSNKVVTEGGHSALIESATGINEHRK